MNSLSVVSVLVVAFSLMSDVDGWITDINPNLLRRSGEDFNETENEIPLEDKPHIRISLTYPGTKWCGPGNVADNYEDLGTDRETDMCCRAHDNCPDLIMGLETRFNLTNPAFYTRLSCDCDETFRTCLHTANTTVANTIGGIYFDVIGTRCFRNDYPKTGCVVRGGILNTKCLQYSYNKNGKKKVQWFDVPDY